MNASDMVVVARLQTHLDEAGLEREHDTHKMALHHFRQFQRDAPMFWRAWNADPSLSARDIGDKMFALLAKWSKAVERGERVSFRNFALDEAERLGLT